MVKPISPDQVVEHKSAIIPDRVIEVFNHLIAQNYSNGSAVVKQDDVIDMLAPTITRIEIFSKHYLDVEDIYRSQGWKVSYDKPAYNESYPATFTFSKK